MKKILITLAFLLPLVAMAQTHVLRKGTQITLRSTQNAKASDLQIGEYLNFAVESPVEVDGNIVIPKGTRVSGTVVLAQKSRIGGFPAFLGYAVQNIELNNGVQVPLEIRLYKVKGKTKIGGAIALGMFTAGIGTAKKGGNAEITYENQLICYVYQNTELPSASEKEILASGHDYNNIFQKLKKSKEKPDAGIPVLSITDAYGLQAVPALQQMQLAQQQSVQPVQTMTAANMPPVTTQQTMPTPTTPMISEAKSVAAIESDVDKNIPQASKSNENAFAIIIANENYQNEVNVQFATNDGKIFKEYCERTLGLPTENIHYRENATLNNIVGEVNWLQKVSTAFDGDARIIFYYAGHGIPDESSKDAYLLPVDGTGTDVATGYKLSKLYEILGKMNTTNVSVFLDACFSGAQRDNGMLASARGVVIKAKPQEPVGSMVVMSAAQGDETAYPYKEKGHGLFTYFLLKKLQESKGECTMQELSDYVKTQVSRRSIVVNNKSQTPAVSYSSSMGDKWKEMKLK